VNPPSDEFGDDEASVRVVFLVREAIIFCVNRMLHVLDEVEGMTDGTREIEEVEAAIAEQRETLMTERSGLETQNSIVSGVLTISDLEMLRSLDGITLLAEASRQTLSDLANARAWFGEILESAYLSGEQREFLTRRVAETTESYQARRRVDLGLEPGDELPPEEIPEFQEYEYPYDDADKLRTRFQLSIDPDTLMIVLTTQPPIPQYSPDGFPLPFPDSLFGINPEVLGRIGNSLTQAEQMQKGKNPYRAALTLFNAAEGFLNLGKGFVSQRVHPHSAAMAYAGADLLAHKMTLLWWSNVALVLEKAQAEDAEYTQTHHATQGAIFDSYRVDNRDIAVVQRFNYPFGTDDYDRLVRWGERGVVSALLIHSGYSNLGRGMMYRERDPGLAMAALGQSAFDFAMAIAGLQDLLQGKNITNDWERHLIAYTITRLISRIQQANMAFGEIRKMLKHPPAGWSDLVLEKAHRQVGLTQGALSQLNHFFDFVGITAELQRRYGNAITAQALLEEDEAETRASSFWILDSLATLEQNLGGFLEVNIDWDEPGEPPYLIRLPQTLGISVLGVEFFHDDEIGFSLPENLGPTFPSATVDALVVRLNGVRDLPPLMGMNTITVRYGEMLRPYTRNATGEFVPMLQKRGGRGGSTPSRNGPPPRGPQRTSDPVGTTDIMQVLESDGYDVETIGLLVDAGYDFDELAQIIKHGEPEAVEEALAHLREFAEVDTLSSDTSFSFAKRSPAAGATLVRSVRPIEVLARLV